MNKNTILLRIKNIYKQINGSTIEYNLTKYQLILERIKKYENTLKNKSDFQIQQLSENLKQSAKEKELTDYQVIEAFAIVREAACRVLKLQPYDVQILGALAMHQGKIAEMQTGEGKTLTAVFPVCLSALSGKGVHVLTFNDYLARRDAQWMGPVYKFLGLSVGFVQEGMSIKERQNAYLSDITYLTAKEAGFDYLRDSLCFEKSQKVQRNFNSAIIDEADSILIDEARIPLVIAGASDDYLADVHYMADIARNLQKGIDFEIDEYARNIHLTDQGQDHLEKLLKCNNLYATENYDLLTRLNCALHAEYLLHKDVDYIVRNNVIELVDDFTGRVADKRRWPDGLQAAIEAKENIDIQSRGNILNSITLQYFIQLYSNIGGMTATAQSAEEEFRMFYKLHIVVIPPNKSCTRIDHDDIILGTKSQKEQYIVDEIIKVHKTGRPILVGTASVEESDRLAKILSENNLKCKVLNAKKDEYEAQIIAQAGRLGAITISTNMAGRGTDIRLGGADEKEKQQVMDLDGLYVIGTNKHESKRIDRQLKGRAGRQGDPGSSRFIISLEDELFVKYRLNELLAISDLPTVHSGVISNSFIKREAERIQSICEGQNLDIKMTLNKYSSLIEKQRNILFLRREQSFTDHSASEFFKQQLPDFFNKYQRMVGEKKLDKVCRYITFYQIDTFWQQYLADIAEIREGIHLKRVGGQDPYIEFQKESIVLFDHLLQKLDDQLIQFFKSIQVKNNEINLEDIGIKAPSATWTYLVNDNPFENMIGMQFIGDMGKQIGGVIMMPILLWHHLFRKKKKW